MTDDDEPKKPPRASWEPPEPQPVPPRKSRAPAKPPRASWEPPEPEDTAPSEVPKTSTSGSTTSSSTKAPTPSVPTPSAITTSRPTPSAPAPSARAASVPASSIPASSPTSSVPLFDIVASEATLSAAEAEPVTVTSEDFASELATPTGEPSVQAYVDSSSSSIAAEPWTAASQPYAAYPTEPQPVMPSGSIPAPTAPTASDDPLAPLPSSDRELRASASLTPSRSRSRRPPTEDELGDDDDNRDRSGGNKILVVSLFAGVLGLGIAAMVIFGTINKNRYVISCEPDAVVAGQGRGFPPWGTRALEDAQWKPMKIPPEAECKERETEDENELSGWYLEILEGRASMLLQATEVTKLDEAAGLLEQALLHARSPDRRDARAKIERMLGDVQYWRASAKLRDAATALTEAAKQFDAASQQIPRYVKDASAWAIYVRKLVEDLQAGPTGASTAAFPPTPPPERVGAPPGVALPVEPDSAGSGSEPAPPPAAPPDAGIPTGGVLL